MAEETKTTQSATQPKTAEQRPRQFRGGARQNQGGVGGGQQGRRGRGGGQGHNKERSDRSSRDRQDSDSKLLDLARVTRVAAGGRRFRFRAVVIFGDKEGQVGVGVAKGADVAQAVEKATRQAKKNAIVVPMEGGTIPHEVEAKFGASRVLLRPQTGGRGLVAGGPVRIICELAGLQNVSGKFISKTHNKLNNALATIEALKKLKAPKKKYADTSSANEK